MSELRSIGLKYIKIGPPAGDGGMSTTLEALGVTYQDTAELTTGDPELTEIFSEENEDPEEIIETKGTKGIKWSIINFDPDVLVKVLGGTNNTGEWEASRTYTPIEMSVEALSANDVRYQAARCKIIAKINAQFRKKGVALVDIEAKILIPTKAGEPPLKIKKIVA